MKFPNPEHTTPEGILAMGGDLDPQTLKQAYTNGIFPWPHPGYPLLWFCPPERGVLFLDKFKIPKSTKRKIRQDVFEVTRNKDFNQVIENCSKVPRSEESGTWILPEMIEAYKNLFKRGEALSFEAWEEGELAGGLYGVLFDGVFSGESMFFKKSEASKVCLVKAVEYLLSQGHEWIDIQMVTPLLEKMGGEYIPRKQFLIMLKERHANR